MCNITQTFKDNLSTALSRKKVLANARIHYHLGLFYNMPQLIEHIDKICRDKGRDVLYIAFDRNTFDDHKWETWLVRKQIVKWFGKNNIEIINCGGIASENGFESYRGQLYLDVPYDENEPDYIKVRDFLENADGSPRIQGILFYYVSLDLALKNKHHDEPGFWDKWAEEF